MTTKDLSKDPVKSLMNIVSDMISRTDPGIKILREFISREKDLYILYSGNEFTIALSFYLLMKSLMFRKKIFIEEIERFSLFMAPYDEGFEPSLIILSSEENYKKIFRYIPSLVFTGHEILMIRPKTDHEIMYKEMITSIDIEEKDNYDLYLIYLLLGAGIDYTKKISSSPRVERLYREIHSLADLTKDLYEKYEETLHKISNLLNQDLYLDIISTPSAKIFAEIIRKIRERNKLKADILVLDYFEEKFIRKDSYTIVVYTEVEKQMISEIIGRSVLYKKDKLIDLYLNTDPLISPLYFALLAKLLERICANISIKDHTKLL